MFVSFLLFAALFLLVLAAFVFFVGADALKDPFADGRQLIAGFVLILLIGPCILTGAWSVNDYRVNYCPPLEPIVAPDLADYTVDENDNVVPSEVGDESAERGAVTLDVAYLNAENERLANELSLKTTALTTASETILTLQNRIKALESTRIIAPALTPTPISATPTTPPCSGGSCRRRPGCN